MRPDPELLPSLNASLTFFDFTKMCWNISNPMVFSPVPSTTSSLSSHSPVSLIVLFLQQGFQLNQCQLEEVTGGKACPCFISDTLPWINISNHLVYMKAPTPQWKEHFCTDSCFCVVKAHKQTFRHVYSSLWLPAPMVSTTFVCFACSFFNQSVWAS